MENTTPAPRRTVTSIASLIDAWIAAPLVRWRRRRARILRERYRHLYAPLVYLFVDRPVTTAVAILAPRLRDRLRNGWTLFKSGRPWQALTTCFDKRRSKEHGEFDYGDEFPMQQVFHILRDNMEYADERLVDLVRRAYEAPCMAITGRPDNSSLTGAELDLYRHIHDTYHRLGKRLGLG